MSQPTVMIKIRLARQGRKKAPYYRIVAIEQRSKREGKPLDIIGLYIPSKKKLQIDKEKLANWIKKGAKITPSAKKLINQKVI